MKKFIYIMLAVVITVSCDKNRIGDFDEQISFEEIVEPALNKKGADFSYKKRAWSHKTHDVGAHWFYHWGNTPREEIPENVEYVPMFWGKNSVTDENINRMKQLKEEGKIKYVLGFNEPDGADQANMSVDEAIALWPKLEEIGLPLGSPAAKNPENAWMKEFMQKADELGLRIDFVTVHHYGGANPLSLINKLKNTYQAYNRPIWITEFAVGDWSATSPENNKYSEADVLQFMMEVLPALDEIEWVHRYSWYDGFGKAQLHSSALFDEDDNLTELGVFYALHNTNELIGPGTDTEYIPPVDEDELIGNGNFETGEIAPWVGFKNGVVGVATTEPHTGNYSGRIQNGDGSLVQIVPIEAGKTYTLNFFSKWNETVTNSFTGIIKDNTAGSAKAKLWTLAAMPKGTDWAETTFEFTVPAGVTELKFVFYKGQGFPPFFMDDISLKENK